MSKLHFKISSGLKNIIGSDLITDEFIAIYELVKNSFDAYATRVDILFDNDRIVIQDNGKGMSYDDLIEKWLFVAYSAKKEGTEDQSVTKKSRDYRSELTATRYYAGAKGIGRFSCDRLGSILTMYSAQQASSTAEKLHVDWEQFEENAEIKFEDVEVNHENVSVKEVNNNAGISGFAHGTILDISGLRTVWSHEKLKLLRRALTKLINPFDENTSSSSAEGFSIFLHAPEFVQEDSHAKNENDVVNGEVKNYIIELVKLKSTSIQVRVTASKILTRLEDRGVLVYEIEEDNVEYGDIDNIDFFLYFLNTAAKSNFTRRMGLPATQFGSIFLFKNGFRVYPFGEPGDDMLGIDRRKQQGYNRFLGTRDLLGRIEIRGDAYGEKFRETSSRDGGLVDTTAYRQLVSAFVRTSLVPLERYVTGILWHSDIAGDLDRGRRREADRNTEEPFLLQNIDVKAEVADLLSNLTRGKKNAILLNYDPKLLEVANAEVSPNVSNFIDRLYNFADKVQDKALLGNLDSTKKHIARLEQELQNEAFLRKQEEAARRQAEQDKRAAEQSAREASERAAKAEEEAKAEQMANTLLKSTIAPGLEQVVSLHHLVGISSGTIDVLLNTLHYETRRATEIPSEFITDIIDKISFENKKIHVVTQFATKANFVMHSEEINADLSRFLLDYLTNISATVFLQQIKIEVVNHVAEKIHRYFKPIEISMIIDNLVSNSWKARAANVTVSLESLPDGKLLMRFSDDGKGVPAKIADSIFKFGYTTTRGSGLGLHHVQQILTNMGATITLNSEFVGGAEFLIVF